MRPATGENLPFHAARLLVLCLAWGARRSPGLRDAIRGRTLLAKLDFFLRYPAYLRRATEIRARDLGIAEQVPTGPELDSVESRMVRYLYGPWDLLYYDTLAYLIGKGLLEARIERGVEQFTLTESGRAVARLLAREESFAPVLERAQTLRRIFSTYSGSQLKSFIYAHFPEVVSRRIGAPI